MLQTQIFTEYQILYKHSFIAAILQGFTYILMQKLIDLAYP